MSNQRKRVGLTVVIPAFNAQRTIQAAIRSAADSGAAEVIVVDDGSQDDTASLARELGARVLSQKNAGAAAARALGVRNVRTSRTILLDSDDRLLPKGVAALMNAMETENCAVANGGYVLRQPCGLGGYVAPWLGGIDLRTLLRKGRSCGPPGTILWNAAVLEECLQHGPPGLWPRYAEDYELAVRAARIGRFVTCDIAVCEYATGLGKSAIAPRKSLESASRIREYYARMDHIAIRPWTSRDVDAMLVIRAASQDQSEAGPLNRGALLARAFLISPRFMIAGLTRKIIQFAVRKAGRSDL